MLEYFLNKGLLVKSAREVAAGNLGVEGKRIAASGKSTGKGVSLDVGGSFVYPALINTHDHLRGNYLPRVGPKPGEFYHNWLPWDNDLKASETYVERSKLSVETIYALSAYKNLFSGVTTVNDHFPHHLNQHILPALPIRAIQEYTLAHECSSYDLKWGEGIEIEHRRARERNWPFITHLSEGFDEESLQGLANLERMGVLDDHCLFVHCIGFSEEDIAKTARAGASISWCPASNMFMFNVTCKIRQFLAAGVNVSLGTDSTHTGSYNLLAEMSYARSLYRELYGEELPAKTLFEMVTGNAARAFRMQDYIGALEPGKWADILVLTGRADDPFENLVSASMEDIELMTLGGKPLYGDMRFLDLLGGRLPAGYSAITVGTRQRFVIGDPGALYRGVRQRVGFQKKLAFLPFEPDA